MRYITALLVALALPLSAQTVTVEVDTTNAAQAAALASINAAKAAALAAGAQRTADWCDSISTAESLDVPLLGTITFVADTIDSLAVEVEIPAAADSTGAVKALAAQALIEARQDFNGKPGTSAIRVRLRRDRALDFRRELAAALNP